MQIGPLLHPGLPGPPDSVCAGRKQPEFPPGPPDSVCAGRIRPEFLPGPPLLFAPFPETRVEKLTGMNVHRTFLPVIPPTALSLVGPSLSHCEGANVFSTLVSSHFAPPQSFTFSACPSAAPPKVGCKKGLWCTTIDQNNNPTGGQISLVLRSVCLKLPGGEAQPCSYPCTSL